jgi:hypothetical protein
MEPGNKYVQAAGRLAELIVSAAFLGYVLALHVAAILELLSGRIAAWP